MGAPRWPPYPQNVRSAPAGPGRLSLARELAGEHPGDRLGLEAELEERHALVEVLAVARDAPALELEHAHAAKAHASSRAARDRLAHDVAERPLGRGRGGRLDDLVHHPGVVTALAEHPREHLAQRGLAGVDAEERVDVAAALVEARQQTVHVLPVERLLEVAHDAHGGPPRVRPEHAITEAEALHALRASEPAQTTPP